MKRSVICFFLCTGIICMASAQEAVVFSEQVNVAYEEVDNPLTIAVENCNCSRLSLSVSSGEVKKAPGDGPCSYIFRTTKTGKAIFTIKKKEGLVEKDIGTVTYRVKPLALPGANLGGRRGGMIPVAVFKAQIGVSAVIDGFDFDIPFKIARFRVKIIRNDALIGTDVNEGSVFVPGVKALLQKVQPGDKATFYDIICRKPSGAEAALEQPLNFTIIK